MNTHDLIKNLVGEMKPVLPIGSLTKAMTVWWSVAIAAGVGGLALFGVRFDLVSKWLQPYFIFETLLLLLFIFFTAAKAYLSSVPGRDQNRILSWGMGLSTGGLFVSLMLRFEPHFDSHYVCSLLILFLSLLPNVTLTHWLVKSYPLDPRTSGMLVGAASAGMGVLTMQFVCAHDHSFHVVAWHIVPLIICALLLSHLVGFLFQKKHSIK